MAIGHFQDLNLIPEPQTVRRHETEPAIEVATWKFVLRTPDQDKRLALKAMTLFGSCSVTQEQDGIYSLVSEGTAIDRLAIRQLSNRHDGYVLEVRADKLELYALCPSGLFYGLTTLETLLKNGDGRLPALSIADWSDLELRSDYLDLRTVYPTFEHIIEYVAELSRYKINTLVVEYEDKLPFRRHKFLRHPDYVWSEEQHSRLLDTAYLNFVQIIPKQQSFGHLEYILKHPQYIHLRETPEHVGELCPHRSGSYEMMAGILEEVAELHPRSRYLHMGCDEVWSLGICPDCLSSGLSREQAFVNFVNRLASKVVQCGKIPMIWHDMLAHATDQEISQLDKRIVVVVWIYGGHGMKRDAESMLTRLQNAGIQALGASSVRCWDDSGDQNYPVIHNRVRNIANWVELAQTKRLAGIIHTNWSAPFSLGSPYGLFETSRYPAFFAADRSWKTTADAGTFLKRFMLQYHGIPSDIYEQIGAGLELTDYYAAIPQFRPYVVDNVPTADLIEAMLQYEVPAKRRFPLHTFLFRGDWSEGSEEVITCFKEKYRSNYKDLEEAKVKMRSALAALLPEEMAELYIRSRYYLFELYESDLRQIINRYASDNTFKEREGETK